MKTKITSVVLVLFFVLMNGSSLKASHLAGGSITYTCVSTNTYLVKITLYRDCAGEALATPSLTIRGCGDSVVQAYTGPNYTPLLVSLSCGDTRTTCDVPAGIAPGIQKYEYLFTCTLTAAMASCNDVIFSYDGSFRNGAITNLNSPGNQKMYLEAHLNSAAAPCNSSPNFSIDPELFFCVNQKNCFNLGFSEPNGDEKTYSFINPRQVNGFDVVYNPGFDSTHSIVGTQTIDSLTGDICLTASSNGQVPLVTVKVTEKRLIAGVWTVIGSVMREIEIYTIICSNKLPELSGFNGTNLFNVEGCAGNKICYNIFSYDADIADSVKISMANCLPAGSYSITNGKRPIGHHCYQTTIADSGKKICCTIIVRDNACPQNGASTYTYCINMVYGTIHPKLTMMNDTIYCNYIFGTNYQWYFNGSPAGGNYPFIPASLSGMYYVDVTDSINCSGRSDTISFIVGIPSLQNTMSIKISPNPFSKLTKIALQNTPQPMNAQFTLTDIFGRNVMNKKMEKNELVINRGNLTEGIYFYSIHDNNKMIAAGKILIVE